ncbi:hypothetical protein EIM48_07065 [Pseudoxanthomonas sp. SGNA-20]|nr:MULTISPECIES: hypothetical protein [Pseudoxanthomonas]RRN56290.1 hypothetical protein EIM48_07065 [Pseudoxanthomonas sp. SGNA-20]
MPTTLTPPVAPSSPPLPASFLPAMATADEPPPFNVPLTVLAEANGRSEIFHGFHDGEAWYAYDLPASGQWQVVAWQAGYRPWPPGLPDGVRLPVPAPLHRTCGLVP